MLGVNIKWKSYGKYIAWCLGHIRPLIKIITSFPAAFLLHLPFPWPDSYTGLAEKVTQFSPPPIRGHLSVILLKYFLSAYPFFVLNFSLCWTHFSKIKCAETKKKIIYCRITLPSRTFYNDEMPLAILVPLPLNLGFKIGLRRSTKTLWDLGWFHIEVRRWKLGLGEGMGANPCQRHFLEEWTRS